MNEYLDKWRVLNLAGRAWRDKFLWYNYVGMFAYILVYQYDFLTDWWFHEGWCEYHATE
jgi:hypothetical protein